MSDPTNWEEQPLWTTGDNPVDNPVAAEPGFPPHAPPFQNKDLSFLSLTVDSLIAANEMLAACVEALQLNYRQFLELIGDDNPLGPSERLERIRELKANLPG